MGDTPHELACSLAEKAEAVCRHYLSNGRRVGRYWLVGDVRNAPGRSLYVRLVASPRAAAGKWVDAATGEHGDLLDVIRENCGFAAFKDVADEARSFLGAPNSATAPKASRMILASHDTPYSARRLFQLSQPIAGTLAHAYLQRRGITQLLGTPSLRFHPRCYHRPEGGPFETWPAMIAAVTNLDGDITGVHRTWLDPRGLDKAPLETPRRAMGDLLGNAVRFGSGCEVMAAGEGIETVLSVRQVLADMPALAALSAGHLAAVLFPDTLRRLYILRDKDPSGNGAGNRLVERASRTGIEAIVLSPCLSDFNEDLCNLGLEALRRHISSQIAPADSVRFLSQSR